MPQRPISHVWIVAGICLLSITPFFWWGNPSGHDFEFHMFSWMEVLGQWKHGIIYPRWAGLSYWGYGEARFLFYPPASWTLGAVLGAILPWKLVPGFYCWLTFALAGAAMYRLASEWLPARDALFAATFYAVNPYHLLIVYWRSSFAELLGAILLPLLLLCLTRLKQAGSRSMLYLSLVFAAAWLTNIPAALMIHYSAAGLVLFLIAQEFAIRRSWTPEVSRLLTRTGLAVFLGAGLASFYLVPVVYEQGWIDLSQVMSPGVRPQDNFLFTTTADADHNRFNLLVSSLAVIEICGLLVAIWFCNMKRRVTGAADSHARETTAEETKQDPWSLVSFWGAGSAFLMLSISSMLWRHLPKFQYVQLPFRWLLCMNAAMALVLATAMRRWSSRLLLAALMLAVIITLGYRIQPPWWESAADIREMTDAMATGIGYEGTDEYVPAGVDVSELNKDLPRVSNSTGGAVSSEILTWGETEKHFKVHVAVAQNLTVRLFNYPAWQVIVDGKRKPTLTSEVTGLLVIPVGPGDNDIYIYFRRTIDRTIGAFGSLISIGVLIAAGIRRKESPM